MRTRLRVAGVLVLLGSSASPGLLAAPAAVASEIPIQIEACATADPTAGDSDDITSDAAAAETASPSPTPTTIACAQDAGAEASAEETSGDEAPDDLATGAESATAEPDEEPSARAAAATGTATITAIEDQAVLTSARTGDRIAVEVSDLAAEASVTVQLCDSTGACTLLASLVTDAEGAADTTLILPADLPAGEATLDFDDGSTQAVAPLTVLGTQIVAAAEALTADTTIVTLTGTGWDPERPVTIQGFTGTDSSTDPTSDPQVEVAVDAAGEFTAEYEVSDAETTSVIVDQARTSTAIGSVYLVSGVIGSGGGPGEQPSEGPSQGPGDTPTDSPTTAPTTAPTQNPAVPPVAVDPVPPGEAPGAEEPEEIPLPGDVPVDDVTAEPVPGEEVEELSVSEARLDGVATLGEMFGGSPERDLIFLVENVGASTIDNPIVRVAVGRSAELEPQIVAVEVGQLDPGDQAVVTVPLELPMAAFGTYRVVGQVGEDATMGGFELEWTTYPWGLFVLNGLGALLLAWGIRHRLLAAKPAAYRPAGAGAGLAAGEGDAVVDLTAAESWWAYRARGGIPAAPSEAGAAAFAAAARAAEDRAADEAVVDLAAAEKWWARRAESGTQAS